MIGSIKEEDAIAFFKLQVITPMLEAPKGMIDKTAIELSKQQFNDVVNKRIVSYSYRTLYKFYSAYKKLGFDGLKPRAKSSKGSHPAVPSDLIKEILLLKEELPARSAQKIIVMLELSKKADKGFLKLRTVNRILNHYGYTRENLTKDHRVYIKHEKDCINKMWQSDIMEACYLPDKNGESRLAYLIGFIDDHSRKILHAQFYFDATLTRLEDCLQKAVTKFGAPDSLFVDNGKVYVSDQFKIICAKLGITLKYSTPFHPSGKGKIEVHWKYVQSSFIPEIKKNKVSNIIELNDLFQAWLKYEYHEKHHGGIGMTPDERWNSSLKAGTKLRYFSPVQIDEIFMHCAERSVNKYGVISFEGNTYEADAALVMKKVEVRYNPFHLDILHLYYDDKYYGVAKIIDLNNTKHKSVRVLEEDPLVDSDTAKKYLANIKSNYQEYLESQLSQYISKDNIKDASHPDTRNESEEGEEQIFRAPKDNEIVIDKEEFISIVSAKLGIENVTFTEKAKLYDLWKTFKEFNKDILISILDDIKDKSSDFNRNFLYYLSEIKRQYEEQLKALKESGGNRVECNE